MNINWFSNAPWASTGYGNQTNLVVPRLVKAGHKVSISAFWGLQGGIIGSSNDNIMIYPAGRHPYGQDIMNSHAKHSKSDLIISLIDAWIIQYKLLTYPWFPWYPVDHEPMPRQVKDVVSHATKGITMSKFGFEQAKLEGLDSWYIPHSVDTNLYTPKTRQEARRRMNLDQEVFLVGMVAANKGKPPRKCFYEHFIAFAALKKKYPNCMLYIHADDGTRGGEVVNLPIFLNHIGLKPGEDYVFADQYQLLIGFPPEYMVDMYNALDVLMLVSRGEGFGIPLIEAQACGTPVITGSWTSMDELCFGGWKVEKKDTIPYYEDGFDAWQFIPKPDAILEKLLEAYENRDNQEIKDQARLGALQYDADKVFKECWLPVLEEMEEIVKGSSSEPFKVTRVEL